MKQLRSFLLLLFSFLFLMSCAKDKVESPDDSTAIAGTYKGKYGFDNATPASFYSFNIKPNGTMEELNSTGGIEGAGTWVIEGNTFKCNYKWVPPYNNTFFVVGTYDANAKTITGTWGYGASATDGGTWYMKKQ